MKIRYTYFKAQPFGYAIYDELARRVVSYTSSETLAIGLALRLNHGEPDSATAA